MSKHEAEDAQIEAAKERLKKFEKSATEVNHHDPERLARWRGTRPDAPRRVSWAELGRQFRVM